MWLSSVLGDRNALSMPFVACFVKELRYYPSKG
jgi:hypothetical protein